MTIIKDDLKNIQRIVDVIKSDSDIFDPNIVGKLRSVEFGNPKQMIPNSVSMPYCYVTVDDPLQKTSYPYGVTIPENISQITVGYKIVIVSDMDDKQVSAEKKLYNLLNLMRDTLTADPLFSDPADPGTDPIFTRSIINESRWENDFESSDKESVGKGKPIQLIKFTLIATIGEELTITIPGFGDLVILSDSGDDGRNNTKITNDEGFTKRSKGDFVGTRFFEYEYDTTTWESLEEIIDASNPINLILQYPSGDVTYPAKLEYQRQSKRFDGIRTVFLQVNRETV